ncbi:MAG TPA: transglutaminase family protein [Rhodocyclaceae bacterium]
MPATHYHVRHETAYEYTVPITLSRHIAHLEPRMTRWQRIVRHDLEVVPVPGQVIPGVDPFGNPVARISIATPHERLAVVGDTEVAVAPRPWAAANFADYWDWLRTVEGLRYRGGLPVSVTRFRFESPHVRVKRELAALATPSLDTEANLAAACLDLTRRIHSEFAYEPTSTEIGTSVLEVLHTKKGVCQDFAHLMISALRSNGLAARYVSGYLLTEAAPGSERLVGVDASHAWVAVYCPNDVSGGDWIEFDPTNGCLADTRYITLGWGRDFSDVSPLRGVILGGGEHDMSVAVTVSPVDPNGSLRD